MPLAYFKIGSLLAPCSYKNRSPGAVSVFLLFALFAFRLLPHTSFWLPLLSADLVLAGSCLERAKLASLPSCEFDHLADARKLSSPVENLD